jgi:glycosyltransferase involved in cell wall biosynthesis
MENKNEPLISIITVVYNSKDLLEYTIKSIITQNYRNIEYIIIDGGSTDGTLDIINYYSTYIAFWISERDTGIYDAMNKGLHKAKGEYVWFINSGDEIANPDVLFTIFDKNNKIDCYYGNTLLISSNRKVKLEIKAPEDLSWESMFFGMVVSHQSIIFKRTCVGNYNLDYKLVSDLDWIIRSLKASTTIKKINIVFSKYLIGGFSDNNFHKCWKERMIITANYFGKHTLIYSIILFIIANGKRITKKLLKLN